jgi:hypothetical protein
MSQRIVLKKDMFVKIVSVAGYADKLRREATASFCNDLAALTKEALNVVIKDFSTNEDWVKFCKKHKSENSSFNTFMGLKLPDNVSLVPIMLSFEGKIVQIISEPYLVKSEAQFGVFYAGTGSFVLQNDLMELELPDLQLVKPYLRFRVSQRVRITSPDGIKYLFNSHYERNGSYAYPVLDQCPKKTQKELFNKLSNVELEVRLVEPGEQRVLVSPVISSGDLPEVYTDPEYLEIL